jgi:hypothetical protein
MVDFQLDGIGRDIMLTDWPYRTLRVNEKITGGLMAGKTNGKFTSVFISNLHQVHSRIIKSTMR